MENLQDYLKSKGFKFFKKRKCCGSKGYVYAEKWNSKSRIITLRSTDEFKTFKNLKIEFKTEFLTFYNQEVFESWYNEIK